MGRKHKSLIGHDVTAACIKAGTMWMTVCRMCMAKGQDAGKTYLTREGDGGLVKTLLLWVTDVGVDDSVEGEAMVFGLELCPESLCLYGELTANGVLDVCDCGVEVVWGKGTHCVMEKTMMMVVRTEKGVIDSREDMRPGFWAG